MKPTTMLLIFNFPSHFTLIYKLDTVKTVKADTIAADIFIQVSASARLGL